jgi:hypothetical protein
VEIAIANRVSPSAARKIWRDRSLHKILCDPLFVPFDAAAGPLVEHGAAVHDAQRLLDDGIEP